MISLKVLPVIGFVCLLSQLAAASDDCPRICPDLYLPVCGGNGAQFLLYPNECEMAIANCKLKRDASQALFKSVDIALCRAKEGLKGCSQVCPMIYSPVCASKGRLRKTFASMCAFQAGNCADGNKWKLLRSSSC